MTKTSEAYNKSMVKLLDLEKKNKLFDPNSCLKGIHDITKSVFKSKFMMKKLHSLSLNKHKLLNLNFKNLVNVFPLKDPEKIEKLDVLLKMSFERLLLRWVAYNVKEVLEQIQESIKMMKQECRRCENSLLKEQLGIKILNFVKFLEVSQKASCTSLDMLDDNIYHIF
jgi:hypothetical protein